MLTMDALEKIVEKYKDLMSKQTIEEMTLLKILGSLQELRMGKYTENFMII